MSHYVCFTGGRDTFGPAVEAAIDDVLHFLHLFYGVGLRVMHGDSEGVDRTAGRLAEARGIPVKAFPADWGRGRGAGPERNKKMAGLLLAWEQLGHSVEVIALPGGRGTEHMVDFSQRLGLNVTHIPLQPPDQPVYEQPTLGV